VASLPSFYDVSKITFFEIPTFIKSVKSSSLSYPNMLSTTDNLFYDFKIISSPIKLRKRIKLEGEREREEADGEEDLT